MKIKISQFGEFLSSRPKGKRDLNHFLKNKKVKGKAIEIDFSGIFAVAPSWLDEFVTGLKKRGASILLGPSENESVKSSLKAMSDEPKVHPWRLCPLGQYWVRPHALTVPSSKKRPEYKTIRHQHCRTNPSGKDQLYPDEMQEIESANFSSVKKRPCPIALGYPNGSKFDDLIAGWTTYWNEVLGDDDHLDPNLVKALIATESSFEPVPRTPNKKNPLQARGLMQVTEQTRKILANEKGELRDHFLTVTKKQIVDPSVNICAGVRWLFHKKHLLKSKLNRRPTWIEVIEEYKGTRTGSNTNAVRIMSVFKEKLDLLNQC